MTDSCLLIPGPRLSDGDEPPVLKVVATDVTPSLVVVEVRGDLDTLTAPGFEEWLSPRAEGRADVVVDLDGVGFMSSAGIAALINIRKESVRSGRRLHVTGRSNRAVQRPLQVLGLETFMELHDDTGAVVARLAATR